MPEATAADLARIREAVQLRDRCTRLAKEQHRRAGLQPSGVYARSTYDAVELEIRASERQRIAETLAPLLAESRFIAEAAVTHSDHCDQAHAGCLAARVRDIVAGKISSDGGGER